MALRAGDGWGEASSAVVPAGEMCRGGRSLERKRWVQLFCCFVIVVY
jgi:hypothetical protein